MTSDEGSEPGEERSITLAVQSGDESTFASLTEQHRRELRVHCYRMLGNFDDAEDLVQETFARAWRNRAGFEGRSTYRAWLYRIATNACLDVVKAKRRRVQVATPEVDSRRPPTFDEVPWLQPIPDDVLVASADEPDAAMVAKETIKLAFLAAVQHLPARQRAVLILRDVLGWSAKETAGVLDASVPAVNSALQRARSTLQDLGRPGRLEWSSINPPSHTERLLVQRYMDAHERADAAAVIELLGEDVRFTMPPQEVRMDGRTPVSEFFRDLFGADNPGEWRLVASSANGQPALANYIRAWGDAAYRAATFDVLQVRGGVITEITTFDAGVFPAFGLPSTLPDGGAR